MRRTCASLLIAVALPAALSAQEPPRLPPAGEPAGARRAELEARLYERFLERATQELGLAAATRERLGDVIKETAESRRELAREGLEVRRSLVAALRDPASPDTTFRQLLGRLDELRERELRIWRRERSRLAEFLSPRQQAEFMGLRARFNDRLLEFRNRRRPPRGAVWPRNGPPRLDPRVPRP